MVDILYKREAWQDTIADSVLARRMPLDPPLLAIPGFIPVPQGLFGIKGLSRDAQLTYVVLLGYAWQGGPQVPSLDALCADLRATPGDVERWLEELDDHTLLRRETAGPHMVWVLCAPGS